MAKVIGAVLGKNSGRIGQVLYRITKGVQFNGAMPAFPKDRKFSPKQLDLQLRFAQLGLLAKAFFKASAIGFADYIKKAPYRNPVSTFVAKNRQTVSATGGTVETDYGQIRVAEGNLIGVTFGTADFEEPLSVTVPFTPNSDAPGVDAADNVYLVVLEPESNMALLSAPKQRSEGSVSMSLPSNWSGLTVHVYGFVVGNGSDNTGEIANSAYIGTGNVG